MLKQVQHDEVKADWTRAEIAALFELPFTELVYQAAELHRTHHAAGLEIVAVNQGDQERRTSDVQRFVDELSLPFTVLIDPRGRSRRNYRLIGLPTTVFVDTSGVIRRVVSGPLGPQQLTLGLEAIGVTR